MAKADRTPVIVGIGMSDYPRAPHLDAVQHHTLAARRAIADAGIAKADLDGYVCAGGGFGGPMVDDAIVMAEYLRIDHRYIDSTMTGGSSFEFHVQHLAAAIRAGLCDTALVTYGSDRLSRAGRTIGTGGGGAPRGVPGPAQYEAPYGNTLVGSYAMHAMRHMHEYGTTPEQLAEIAVGVREFAGFNPNAIYRTPITVEDVLASKLVADPLHLYDCCAVTDGGGAFIMTTAERARDLPNRPVYVLGAAGAQTHWNISQQTDFTSSAGAAAGPIAFAQAGITHDDIDLLMLYDSFTITVLLLLESLGFAPKGQGGPWVQEGHLRRGGKFPLNTDGGGLSSCHPGMRGIFLITEAVRQLRGHAGEVQIPDCKIALCAGSGGFLSAIGVALLGTEAPS